MKPLPEFDLYYPDGVALIDLRERVDIDALNEDQRHRRIFDKLTRATIEIERLKQGWRPDAEVLVDAPLLRNWSFGGNGIPGGTYLLGFVTGHPKIRDGDSCVTSVLLAIDTRDWNWARTVSRFYTLR